MLSVTSAFHSLITHVYLDCEPALNGHPKAQGSKTKESKLRSVLVQRLVQFNPCLKGRSHTQNVNPLLFLDFENKFKDVRTMLSLALLKARTGFSNFMDVQIPIPS